MIPNPKKIRAEKAYRTFRRQNKRAVDEAQWVLTCGFQNRRQNEANRDYHEAELNKLIAVVLPILLLALQCASATTCMIPEGPHDKRSIFPHTHGIIRFFRFSERWEFATLACLNEFMPRLLSNIYGEPVAFHVKTITSLSGWFMYITKGYTHDDHMPTLEPINHALIESTLIATPAQYRCMPNVDLALVAAAAHDNGDVELLQKVFVRYARKFKEDKAPVIVKKPKAKKNVAPPPQPVVNTRARSIEDAPFLTAVEMEDAKREAKVFRAPLEKVVKRKIRSITRGAKRRAWRAALTPAQRSDLRDYCAKKAERDVQRALNRIGLYQEFRQTGKLRDRHTGAVVLVYPVKPIHTE